MAPQKTHAVQFLTILMIFCPLNLLFNGCSSTNSYHTLEGSTWHTTFHITYGNQGKATPLLNDSILAVLHDVDYSLSAFNPSSTVSRINSNETLVIDSMFAEVFTEALRVNQLSNGYFDPTVGPLVDAWGFGRKAIRDVAPPQANIDSLLSLVGIWKCTMVDGKIVKPSPAMSFDFSAIAKGYGCDCVGQMLRRNGVENFMVEIGGEITLAGVNPNGDDWHIQIDRPIEAQKDSTAIHSRLTIIKLTDCGIATSGNYRNYRSLADSTIVSHTINPHTGYPQRSTILSATVIAPTCITADALATAAMAMPFDEVVGMLNNIEGVSAMLVVSDSVAGSTNILPIYVGNFWQE